MKKVNKKRIKIMLIVLVLIAVLLYAVVVVTNLKEPNKLKTNIIKAVKMEGDNNNKKTTEYEIEIKEYRLSNIKKIIEYSSKNSAKVDMENLEFINKYQMKNLGLELKDKRITITIPEDYFFEEIGYEKDNDLLKIDEKNETISVVNQEKIKELLIVQGYTIK